MTERLIEAEDDLDTDLDGDRVVVFHGRGEAPFLDGIEGFLIETHAEGTHDVQIARAAIGTDGGDEQHTALEL